MDLNAEPRELGVAAALSGEGNLAAGLASLQRMLRDDGASDHQLAQLAATMDPILAGRASELGITREALLTLPVKDAGELPGRLMLAAMRDRLASVARRCNALQPPPEGGEGEPSGAAGLALMARVFAALGELALSGSPSRAPTTREVAEEAGLPTATARKVLMALRREGFAALVPRRKHSPLRWQFAGDWPEMLDALPRVEAGAFFYLGDGGVVYGMLRGGWFATMSLSLPIELRMLVPEAGVYQVRLYRGEKGRSALYDVVGVPESERPAAVATHRVPDGLLAACEWAKEYAQTHEEAGVVR